MEQLRCDGTESLEQAIWSEMPYDLLECIASFADIDSRRALGFKPRPLPPLTPPPFRPTQEVFRYLTDSNTLIYMDVLEYGRFEWELTTDTHYLPDTHGWIYGPNAHRTDISIFTDGSQRHVSSSLNDGLEFHLGSHPAFMSG